MRVEFPVVVHLRCTVSMRDEVKARGGGRWLRQLIEANSRPPAAAAVADAPPFDADPPAAPRRKAAKKKKRVSLDKRKRPRVK